MKARIDLWLEKDKWDWLAKRAKEEGCSKSDILRKIVRKYLKKEGVKI